MGYNTTMIIIPSILTDSLEIVQEQVDKTISVGLQRVQVDIIDPDFADEITIHPIDLLELDLRGLEVDFHLMTNEPINDVVECSQIPGVKTIIAQIERMDNQTAFLEHVTSLSLSAGLSLDLYTSVEEIDEKLLPQLAIVQVMGNKAGKQGQPFVGEPALEKIRTLNILRNQRGYSYQICVDIGMTPEQAKICSTAGANIVTPGSSLWNSSDLQSAVEAYQ